MTKYVSHIKSLTITIAPGKPIYEGGIKVGDQEGKYARFQNGEFSTDDKQIIEKLESLPTYGFDFVKHGETPEQTPKELKGDDLSALTVPQLKAKAQEAGFDVPQGALKADIIKLLTPDVAQQEPEGKEDGTDAA